MNSSEAANLFPTQIAEIGRLDDLIKSGTTVVLALILYNKLFVANVGDSRALLCLHQQGREGALMVKQLTVDHTTRNEDELRRLEKCGLNPRELRKNGRLGTQQNTRSIGDYSIKGGYHNMDLLKHATSEPGTAEPYIHEPIDITGCQGFLVLMSDGLYKAYEEWSERPERINEDVAHLVGNELKKSRGEDDNMVAQKVVEKVRHLFREKHKQMRTPGRLDDITLIVKRLGLIHSQSLMPGLHPQHSMSGSMPQTAPVTDKQFEFNGQQVTASLQTSRLPTSQFPTSYSSQQSYTPQPPPPVSSYHYPSTTTHPSQTSYHPTMSENQRGRYGDTSEGDMRREGGAGNLPYPGQQVTQQGMYSRQQGVGVHSEGGYSRWQGTHPGEDSTDHYAQELRYSDGQYRQGAQYERDPRMPRNAPLDPSGRDRYMEEAGHGGDPQYYNSSRRSYPPGGEQGRGQMHQSASGQALQSSLHGSPYGRQDLSMNTRPMDGRFPQDRYGGQSTEGHYPPQESYGGQGQSLLRPQEQLGRGNSMGQKFQGDSYQVRPQVSNYPPVGTSQPSYQHDTSYQGGGAGSFGLSSSFSDDVATPVATPKSMFGNRQQSTGSFTSDTSSSSDLTLIRPPSMAAVDEADTLREEDIASSKQRATNTRQSAPHDEEEGGPQTRDSDGPHTQDSEGQHAVMYLTDDTEDEEEEERKNEGVDDKIDGDGFLKPYVKFGDRFPSDLSWFNIPPPEN